MEPPKKVIKALYNYEAQSAHELGFVTGDFFHVVGRENDTEWYEACNPATGAKGLVPVAFFQSLGRTERDSGGPALRPIEKRETDSGYSEGFSAPSNHGIQIGGPVPLQQPNDSVLARPSRLSNIGKGSGAMIFGIVLFDFIAERPDELGAKQGENIIIIARSTADWFVAKPISRLGGPGLIPVSYLELRDMTTNQIIDDEDKERAIQRAGIPNVEDWKRMAAEYKNSSIPLGKFEIGGAQQGQQTQQAQQQMERMSLNGQRDQYAGNPVCRHRYLLKFG
jgi:bud emergence protein 1